MTARPKKQSFLDVGRVLQAAHDLDELRSMLGKEPLNTERHWALKAAIAWKSAELMTANQARFDKANPPTKETLRVRENDRKRHAGYDQVELNCRELTDREYEADYRERLREEREEWEHGRGGSLAYRFRDPPEES